MKKTLALGFLLFSCLAAFAQTGLPLPFFDDFAKSNTTLDNTKWMPAGSVYVNNHYSNDPISKNVVTFNGVSSTGKMNPSTALSSGPVDTLTSRPINLGGLMAADSVYLTFYLQTGGIGGIPDFSQFVPRYFEVEFKNNNGNWQQARRINPPPSTQKTVAWKQVLIPITDAQYLHANFQFRFRTVGFRVTSEHTWNLDYVQLGSGRRKSDSRFDVTTSRRISPLLERYTAMPIHQFMANINGELNDSLFTTLNNYENQPRAIATTTTVQIGNGAPAVVANHAIPLPGNFQQYREFPDKPNAGIFNGLSGFQDVRSSVFVDTFEPTPETKFNDTISRVTRLHDYYAYDDGSAENLRSYLFSTGVTLGQIAQRFSLNLNDRVKTISVYIPKVSNTKNTVVTFRIWNENSSGNPDGQGIFSKNFSVPDLAQLDTWIDIPVDPSVPVSGSFFAGWTINSSQPIFSVGLDLNKNTTMHYTKFGTTWFTETQGTLMLRVATNNNITGISKNLEAKTTKIYPNPATDFVNLEGSFEAVRVLSATGQLVLEKQGNATGIRLETGQLKPGFYLVQLQHKNGTETHKLIIEAK